MKISGKKLFCVALSTVILLQVTACASDVATNEPEVDNAEISSTTDNPVENVESEDAGTEETEPAVDPEFQIAASNLIPMDYDAKVLANRNEDGSKKYVSSDVAPTICYDNLSLGFLTESSISYRLELVEGSPVDTVALSAIDEQYNSIPVEQLAAWDSESNTLTANQDATANGTVFLDLKTGDD
ncbi:MAG: hypothetical protein K2H45_12210, partial [Acetatifactor sp.]|nr:hypothetical protein [Acetatifactor sp.]